jgi:predicted secreted protein
MHNDRVLRVISLRLLNLKEGKVLQLKSEVVTPEYVWALCERRGTQLEF